MNNVNNTNNGQNFVPPQPPAYNAPQGQAPAAPYTYAPPKPKKVYSPLTKKDKRLLPLFVISAFIFADFLVSSMLSYCLELTVFCFVQFIFSTLYLYDKSRKPSPFTIACGVLSLVGSVTFTLLGDSLINFLMLVLIACLYGLYCIGLSGGFTSGTGSYRIIFDFIYDTFVKPFKAMPDFVGALKAGDKKEKKNLSALLGILLAVPVLLVVVPLLIKSDAAFEGLVKGLAGNIGTFITELVITVIILPYFISYTYSKTAHKSNAAFSYKTKIRKVPYSAGVSFLSVISIVYLVYLFSQLAYFFSAFSGALPEGYTLTASAFARRGFFEMFAICCINVALVSLVLMFCKRNDRGRVPLSIKLLSLFISVFDFVLLISASAKMVMNVNRYDLSRNRVLVCTFMLMIAVVLVFFTVHIFAPKVPYMRSIIMICSVIFIVMSYSNIDARIAEYNVKQYRNSGVTDSVDVQALYDLGDGGVEALIMLSNDKNAEYSSQASYDAYSALVRITADNYELDFDNNMQVSLRDVRAFNLSRYNALKAIAENCRYLKENDYDKYLDFIGEPLEDNAEDNFDYTDADVVDTNNDTVFEWYETQAPYTYTYEAYTDEHLDMSTMAD